MGEKNGGRPATPSPLLLLLLLGLVTPEMLMHLLFLA